MEPEQGGYNHDVPEEMGFEVSVDPGDMDEYVDTEERPSTAKWDLSSTSRYPFNSDTVGGGQLREMTDEAMGYLSGATYRQDYHFEMDNLGHNQDKVDLTEYEDTRLSSDTQYDNVSSLKAAIKFDSLEGIKGYIIEEIDYENVTVIKTDTARGSDKAPGGKGGDENFPPHSSHLYGSSIDNEQDYLNVESFETEQNSKENFSFRNPMEEPLRELSHLQVAPEASGYHQGSLKKVASHVTYNAGELESDIYINVPSTSQSLRLS